MEGEDGPQNLTDKTSKGRRDHNRQQMALCRKVLSKIVDVSKCHGAENSDTPFFELEDLDIAGQYDQMLPDVERGRTVSEILSLLQLGPFKVKVNHSQIPGGMFEACSVPRDNFHPICSSVDKLDKDRIGDSVRPSGGRELVEQLLNDPKLKTSKAAQAGVGAMKLVLNSVGLSLARGLDFYTNVIHEAVLLGDGSTDVGVGSVAVGARYDSLVGMFDPKNRAVPCVGVGIDKERGFSVIEANDAARDLKQRTTEVEVYVAVARKNSVDERFRIFCEPLNPGQKVEHSFKNNTKLLPQLQCCEEPGSPSSIYERTNGKEVHWVTAFLFSPTLSLGLSIHVSFCLKWSS